MKLKLDPEEYGFKWNYVIAIYYKNRKWRAYSNGCYRFRRGKWRDNLIKEICQVKRVKPSAVMLGTVDRIVLDVDVTDCYIEKETPKCPQFLIERMEKLKKHPPPTLEMVERQMQGSINQRRQLCAKCGHTKKTHSKDGMVFIGLRCVCDGFEEIK